MRKQQSPKQEIRYRTNINNHIIPFIDAETVVQLEPSLNKHFVGSSKIRNNQNMEQKSLNNKHPPPLPETPSSSDVYTKKIESFKKKLKNLKNLSTPSSSTYTSSSSNPSSVKLSTTSATSILINTKTLPSNSGKKFNEFDRHFHGHQHYTHQYNNIENSKSKNIYNKPIGLTYEKDFSNLKINNNSFETSSPTVPSFSNSLYDETNTYLQSSSKSDIPITRRSNIQQYKCSICNIDLDTFYNLKDGERVIDLKCNHIVHEECLIIELELNISMSDITLPDKCSFLNYFPHCGTCSNSTIKAIPKDDTILTDLYNRILTSNIKTNFNSDPNLNSNSNLNISLNLNSTSNLQTINNTSNLSVNSPLTPTFSDSSKYLDTEFSSNSEFISNQLNALDVSKNVSNSNTIHMGFIANNNKQQINFKDDSKKYPDKSNKLNACNMHSKKESRGSVASATSAIISSASNDINNIDVVESSWCSGFSPEMIQKKFLDELINLSSQSIIKDSIDSDIVLNDDFLKSLGSLRIVDKINLVSCIDDIESKPIEYYCYLFQHMLLILNSFELKFDLISINLSTYIDSSKPGYLILKNSKNSKNYHKFIFPSKILEINWATALNNLKIKFDSKLFTSTIKIDEFDDLINMEPVISTEDVETLNIFHNYIGDDGYERLPTGVCPRFYESTINSLIFKSKPSNAIIVLNQTKPIPNSVVSIKNIVKSLLMIGIDVLLIFCSSSDLSLDSNIIHYCELTKKEFKKHCDDFLSNIDYYQEIISGEVINYLDETVYHRIIEYTNKNKKDPDIVNVMISNTSLKKIKDIPTINNILIELGLDIKNKSNRLDVVDLADWSEIMEVICAFCGLEFDESDFYLSSDDSDTDDCDNDDEVNIRDNEDKINFRIKNRSSRSLETISKEIKTTLKLKT